LLTLVAAERGSASLAHRSGTQDLHFTRDSQASSHEGATS